MIVQIDIELDRIRELRDKIALLDMERQEAEQQFCSNFRAWRIRSGIQLSVVAKDLDISKAYLSDIERGRRGLSPEMVIKLAKYLRDRGK